MPYTSETKNIPCYWYSSRNGGTSWTGTQYNTITLLSRNGANGIFTRDGVSYLYIKVPKNRRYVKEVITYYVKKRIIVGYRVIKARPIFKTFILRRPGLPATKVSRQIGITKERRKPIYGYIAQPRRRKIWSIKTYFVSKKITLPPVSLPDLTPHYLNFRSEIRSGHETSNTVTLVNKNNPLDRVVTVINGATNGFHAGVGSWGLSIGFQDNVLDDWATIEPLRSQSLYRMSSSARNNIANLANAVVEYQGLKATIAQWAISTLQILIQGKKAVTKALTDLASDPQKISSAYLGYVYGVSPLISDTNKLIGEICEPGRTWRRYSGRASNKWTLESSGSNEFSSWTIKRTFKITVKNQVMITGTQKAPIIQNHAQTNNLAAGWEFIPFSFVADWFIPIGSWLESLDLFEGVTVKNWHESRLYTETYEITVTHKSAPWSNWEVSGGTQVFRGVLNRFKREIQHGTPVLPLPKFKNPFSKAHTVNSLMLLIQQLKR